MRGRRLVARHTAQKHQHALHGRHGRAELGSEVDSIEAGPRSSRNASKGGAMSQLHFMSASIVSWPYSPLERLQQTIKLCSLYVYIWEN